MSVIYGKGSGTAWGTRWADTIYVKGAAAGYGQGGDDTLYGDASANKLVGQDGNDTAHSGAGNDALFGGNGADRLFGDAGADMIWGDAGNDWLDGGSGNDKLRGGDGDDVLVHRAHTTGLLPAGSDDFQGGSGNDTLLISVTGETPTYGGAGPILRVDDYGNGVLGYGQNEMESDFVKAGTFSGIETFRLADDSAGLVFEGGALDATVIGGAGYDVLQGGSGDETFIGGGGGDQFQILWRPGWELGNDKIIGFDVLGGDSITKNTAFDDAPDLFGISAIEQAGHTLFTFTDTASGQIVGTLDVDAVGLPPIYDFILG